MKTNKAILVWIFIFCSILTFSQELNKLPERIILQNEQPKTIDTVNPIFISRPELSSKNTIVIDKIPEGKIVPTGTHWYALEKKNDSVYWANVDCKKIIIEIEQGLDFESEEMLSILRKYDISKILNKSMFPEMQNFYEFAFPNGIKESVINLCLDLKKISWVKYAEPAVKITQQSCPPNDTYWSSQWGPYTIYADSVYCYFNSKTRQIIGVIDNAVDYTHTDLYNIVRYGYDYAENDNNPYPGYASQDHGTHVAGIVGAQINNNAGVAGILNDTIYFAKVQDDTATQFLNSTAIVNAMNYIATQSRIRTFNMSFGAPAPSSAQENALITAWNNNKLPIAAAGNDNVSSPSYPAAYTNVVAVSSVGVNGSGTLIPASYSNYGNWIDVSAPGGEISTGYGIVSTMPSDSYDEMQGTSMAAPMVTGVAGLIFAMNPFLSNSQARTILQSQTFDLGTTGYDVFYGNGMVCAICAFLEACSQFYPTISASGATTFCSGNSVVLSATYNFNVLYQWKKNGVSIAGATNSTYTATQSGVYTCLVQSIAGCSNTTNSITVTVNSSPVANFSYAPLSIVQGQNVQFTDASTNSPTSRYWTFGDGGTSTQTNPNHTYSSAGNYTVSLKATNGCGNHTTYQTILVQGPAGACLPAYVPTDSIVGYWAFCGNANDESGNGNTGNVVGATLTTDRNGVANSAFYFNGVNNYIRVLHDEKLNCEQFTISAWININRFAGSPSAAAFIISKGIYPNYNYIMSAGNSSHTQTFHAGTTSPLVGTANTFDTLVWYCVTATNDGTDLKIYVDGSIEGSIPTVLATPNDSDLLFGRYILNSTWNMKGKLDDIGIWNRALKPCEILQLYTGVIAADTTYQSINSCESYTWPLNGQTYSSSGLHSVTVTGSEGCDSVIVLDLTIDSVIFSTQPTNQTVSIGDNVQLQAVCSNINPTYQWQTDIGVGFMNMTNAGQYSGVTTNMLTISNAAMTNNNQQFRCAVSSAACNDTSDVATLTVLDNVGFINQAENQITLYPNPATSEVVIEFAGNNEPIKYAIRNSIGQIVYNGELIEKCIVPISRFSTGLYIVEFENGKTLEFTKVMME